jgi:heavy metal sensor kinase
MKAGSMRVRLTAWYLTMLAMGLSIFGVGSWFAMRASAFHTIDDELQDRVGGVHKFMNEQIASLSPAEIRDEFREHSVLGPGGDLFQVCDERGELLYRSAVLENSMIPIRRPDQLKGDFVFENMDVQQTPVRFASKRVIVNNHPYTIQVAAPLKEFYEALQRFRMILCLGWPALLIAAAIGGYWISSRALAPVDRIAAAAESISISNLSQRLDVPQSADELQRLSETLNRMLARLNSSVQRMSQFTADASHELRAPVALIRTTAELAVNGGRSIEEYHADMVQVLAEAERTSRVIDSLLILARADSGEDGLEMEPVDLTVSVREAAEQSRGLAKDHSVSVDVCTPDHPVVVRGDSDGLRRLVFILVDNAVKYTHSGGLIKVLVETNGPHAICSVEDSGPGISPDDLEHVFDRFWRADKVRSRGMGGAGLGLSIARWIADRHAGELKVDSVLGVRTVFTFQLPLCDIS